MEQFIVVVGNPAEGFFYYGPFDQAEAARDWAESDDAEGTVGDEDWWVVVLNKP